MKYKYTDRKYPQTHRLLAKPQEDCYQTSRHFLFFVQNLLFFVQKIKTDYKPSD